MPALGALTALTLTAGAIFAATAPSAAGPESNPPLSAVSARPEISAYFAMPKGTVAENEKLLRTMQADAITFGSRLKPVSTASLPKAVRNIVGHRRAYLHGAPVNWLPGARVSTDRTVTVAGARYTVLAGPGNTAIVTRGGRDKVAALIRAGNRVHARTIIGLPAPAAGAVNGPAWMPNTSYLPVLAAFTQRFARNAHLLGADGFYQHVEMPVTNTRVWAPVRTLYAKQNAAVNRAAPGALVVISPYLESRRAKASFTPAQAAAGVRMLLRTASGTRLVIAPQDGLGVGSTRLAGDPHARKFVAPLQSYLKAMRAAAGNHLWMNAELMRPAANGNRRPTTKARVSQQLWTHAHYAPKTIAFIWDDPSRGIGAVRVPGGVTTWSAGLGNAR